MAIKVSGTEVISDDKRILNNESLPDIRPSLLLDFANSKTLDPRITFTRGSTATYWDGKTTAKAEENLFKYSQELDNFYWNGLRSVVTANQTTAPDGTTTADAITQASGETSGGFINPDGTEGYTSGVTYTTSIYAKPNGKNFLRVMTSYANGIQTTWFNLSTGSVGTSSSDHTASMVDAGNGWYRCIVTATADGDGYINFYIAETDAVYDVTDDQTGYYAWGAQLEQRSSATAYTPTTSSPIVKYQPVLQTAASGEARFDHDPVTGESKGLLIEEARANSATYSEEFDNAGWDKARVTITPNTIIAPDGTLTADKLIANTDNNSHKIVLRPTITSGNSYTASVYFKKGEYTDAQIDLYSDGSNTFARSDFDLDTGTIIYAQVGSATITDVGNGWYRCIVAGTATTSGTGYFQIYVTSPASSFTGDGYSGIYVWGAQLEAGSFPTSYIPTSGSTVTRALEAVKIENFNNYATGNEGTAFIDWIIGGSDGLQEYQFRMESLSGNGLSIFYDDPNIFGTNYNVSNSGIVSTSTSANKAALTYSQSESTYRHYANGTAGTTTTSGYDGRYAPNVLFLGGASATASHSQQYIKKFAFYPKRLPNATMQAMTEE